MEDLKDISAWEVENSDVALMQWADQIPFGQSEFQNRYYVINSQITPWRQLRQAIMELQARTNSLQKITVQYRRNLNDMARLESEIAEEENEFTKTDLECQLEICRLDTQVWMNKIRQCKEETNGILTIIKERTDCEDLDQVIATFEDPAIIEAEEHKYWIARMAKQCAIDLLTTGRVQSGNLESMLMMKPEDQAAITDLALTYSTAMNHSIGKFKEIAEDKVENMLSGRGPEMFDTSGIFTDYAINNIANRSLQSSDQPET
ncbi:hypothetical protein HOQ65_gp196 [Cyanophage S-RIM12 isolate RW_06_0310]|uniref:Uncharacterized protein n=2 Tax=Brizovirus TaxID=2733098 RepID=A0A1D7SS72_9CAUD|nr:hypothetical protein HOQ65_gp196 [Cyanophage S-RIM12 isolate RW_06_0310]AOO16382.1 hypothetical protein RW060310_040 [Cyanophage S-RIM12 isolate RW_06_0310]AOO18745.1 hypothetical protein W1120610_039 [Cyanophage S-RIM12_W1_12_0610]